MNLVTIGDVVIINSGYDNPYQAYKSVVGSERVRLLKAFRTGALPVEWAAWYAPAFGGARRITQNEVDWASSGIDKYDENGIRRQGEVS